jgi:Fanconi anemia group M protein
MLYDDICFLPPKKLFSYYRADVKKDSKIKVLVDTHEPDNIAEMLTSLGYEVIHKTLDVGDYIFEGGIAFERKSTDFNNYNDVLTKALELKSIYPDSSYLIVESNLTALLKIKNNYNNNYKSNENQLIGLLGALASVNIPPIFVQNTYFAVRVMDSIVKKSLDLKDREILKIDNIRYATDKDYLRGIYLNLPGVGRKIADKLLEVAPNLEALMALSVDDLMKIENIGKLKANKIYSFLHPQK